MHPMFIDLCAPDSNLAIAPVFARLYCEIRNMSSLDHHELAAFLHLSESLHFGKSAKALNMSASALHGHFKAVAGVSPIQYQKHLRLQEARRLLLSEGTSAEAVAYEVGYASPSQFSREYARLFGQPPRRDAERMRERSPVLP